MLNEGEKIFCQWQLHMAGSFHSSLITTIMKADDNNKNLLRLGYPDLVDTVKRYQMEEGFFENLKKRYEKETKIAGKYLW